MKLYMKKISVMIGVFAVMLAFSFSNQNGSLSLAISSAYAADGSQANNNTPNSNANSNALSQVTICHYPIGNQSNPETITVGQPSTVLNGHMDHSDTFGACLVCPAGAVSCVNASGMPGIAVGASASAGKPTSLRDLKGS